MSEFKRVARFEFVSFDNYKNSVENFTEDEIKYIYDIFCKSCFNFILFN